jgi:hypothetical protein
MRMLFSVAAIGMLAALAGCSTTQNVIPGQIGSTAKPVPMRTACLTLQGGAAADTDADVQHSLETHGVSVAIAPNCGNADMSVSYSANWRWDLVMYLSTLDIRFYQAPAGGLIVAGHWENSLMHQFPRTGAVIQGVVDGMFLEAGHPGALLTTGNAASN